MSDIFLPHLLHQRHVAISEDMFKCYHWVQRVGESMQMLSSKLQALVHIGCWAGQTGKHICCKCQKTVLRFRKLIQGFFLLKPDILAKEEPEGWTVSTLSTGFSSVDANSLGHKHLGKKFFLC